MLKVYLFFLTLPGSIKHIQAADDSNVLAELMKAICTGCSPHYTVCLKPMIVQLLDICKYDHGICIVYIAI